MAASDGTMTIVEDTASTTGRDAVTISPLANDTGDHLKLGSFLTSSDATLPQDGYITVKGSSVIYTPEAGFEGTDTFHYSVSDRAGDTQYGIISVAVTDNALPADAVAPTAHTDELTVGNASSAKLDVLANDESGDGSKLLVTGANQPEHGTVDLTGGQLVYHADSGYTGHDSFFYKVFNQDGLSSVAQVNLTVEEGKGGGGSGGGGGGGGKALAVHDDSFNVKADTDSSLKVLKNDQGSHLTIVDTGEAAHGTVAIDQNGHQVTYTPDAGYSGADSFQYMAQDQSGQSAIATVDLTVQGGGSGGGGGGKVLAVNDDSFNVKADTDSSLKVLKNDQGSHLTIIDTGEAAHGTVAIDQNGHQVTYTPDAGYTGADSFQYLAQDQSGQSAFATVDLTVQGGASGGDQISAHNDKFSIPTDSSTDLGVLVNDKGTGLTISHVDDALHGTVAVADDGSSITYTPDAGYHGKDSFTYTAMDANNNTDDATVKLNIKGSSSSSSLKLSDVLSTDHGAASSSSSSHESSSSHASIASVSVTSGSVDLDSVVHQAQHHVG